MRRTIVSAFAAIAGGKMLVTLVMIVSIPLLVRLLGPDGYGMYATLMAIFAMLMILVSSGINAGSRKYLSEDRDEPYWKSNVFGFYLRLAAVLALLGALALLIGAELGVVSAALGDQFAPYFYLLAILTIAAQFRDYLRRSLMGLKLEHISEPIHVGHKIVFAIVAIALVYLGFGVAGVLIGHIFASLVVAAVSLFFLSQHISLTHSVRPTPPSFPRSQLLSFNHLAILYVFLLTSLYHVDVLMLEYFTTSETVGYYKAALVIVEFLWFVPRSIQSVMIQSTANLWLEDNVERINSLASKTSRYTLLITILLAIGLAALASEFVPLYYGAEFTPSILPILLLLPGTIGFGLARPIMAISMAKGDMKILIAATGASATINFVLNLVLIPTYGMAGAAISTSIGYGSLPVFHVAGAHAMGYYPLSDLRATRIAATTVLAGAVIGGLAMVITSPLLSLLIVPPVGGLVFATFAVLTGAVTLEEVVDLLCQLPAPLDRCGMALKTHVDGLQSAGSPTDD